MENNIKNQKKQKDKSVFFFVIVMILLGSFALLSAGLIFGFFTSKIGVKNLFDLKTEKIEELFESNFKNNDQKAEKIKQKIIQEDSGVINAVKEAMPAVVSIVVTKDIPKIQNYNWDPFGFYFNQRGNLGNSETEKQEIGGGTGFFLSENGMIVTNRHVVDDSSAEYTIITNDEEKHSAKVLAIDPNNDIAIIKIEGTGYPVLELGDSELVQIGQTVIAIGNSLGEFSNTNKRSRNFTCFFNLFKNFFHLI